MTETEFRDRHLWDLDAWPEMYDQLKGLQAMVFLAEPGIELNLMVFTVASQAAGCRHCQAHGAYGLDGLGLPLDKIQDLWAFETSPHFDDRERAALSLAMAGGSAPSSVTPEHHEAVRSHFADADARTLIGVIALSGFMNRYNDTLATVTDLASSEWAATNLTDVGWDIGKHVGAVDERRSGPPGGAH